MTLHVSLLQLASGTETFTASQPPPPSTFVAPAITWTDHRRRLFLRSATYYDHVCIHLLVAIVLASLRSPLDACGTDPMNPEGKVGMLGDEGGDVMTQWGPLAVAALAYVAVGAWDWTDTVEALARCVSMHGLRGVRCFMFDLAVSGTSKIEFVLLIDINYFLPTCCVYGWTPATIVVAL